MTTGFCDRDLSQRNCILVVFVLHASCHYLFAAYLFSFQCQLGAQYNLQQHIFQKLSSLIAFFIPCFELTLLKHLF